MRNTVRWVDVAQSLTRRVTPRREIPTEFLLVCTGGINHLIFLAAQLERFRLALGGADVPLVILADHAAGAASFLFDDRAEIVFVDMKKLGEDSGYRARRLSEMFQSHFKGVVSLDYHRHPYLDESMVEATQRPSMAMMPAPLPGLDEVLANNAKYYKNRFDCGLPGTPISLRWVELAFQLSAESPDLPAATPYHLDTALLPEPVACETPTVVLQPFSPDLARQPSSEFFAAVLDAVPADHVILLLGAPELLERSSDINDLLELPNVSLENTDLARALPIMRSARLMIATESAPMHLAAIAGIPTVGIAVDVGNGDILPYPQGGGPENARILIGDDASAEAVAAAVREALT